MNRLDLAARRYRDIVPERLTSLERAERYSQFPSKKLLLWLKHDVCAAVEELWARPVFRQLALWPQRILTAGSGSPVRELVDALGPALATSARALMRLSKRRAIHRTLTERNPPEQVVASESVRIRGEYRCELIEQQMGAYDRLEVLRRQVQTAADWDHGELVSLDDYLWPAPSLGAYGPFTAGEFIVSLSPDLLPVGDFVSRCLIRRMGLLCDALPEFRDLCYEAVRRTGRRYSQDTEKEQSAWRRLTTLRQELEASCLSGRDCRLKDSAIALVQVFAEFSDEPDLSWLGLSELAIRSAAGCLHHTIGSSRNLETVERIAAALGDMRMLLRDMPPDDSAFEQAVATGGLVLRSNPRTAFWETRMINADWNRHGAPWEFLLKLAGKARTGQPVRSDDLYDRHEREDDDVPPSTMYNRWSRLEKLLPPSLAGLVEPHRDEPAVYRLKLKLNQIYIFDDISRRELSS